MTNMPPQDVVATEFMERRGYQLPPFEVTKVEGQHCWYFLYDLPEGILELEVHWNGEQWVTMVTTFSVRDESSGRPLQF